MNCLLAILVSLTREVTGGLNRKCPLWEHVTEHFVAQVVALFGEVMKSLGSGALLEAVMSLGTGFEALLPHPTSSSCFLFPMYSRNDVI